MEQTSDYDMKGAMPKNRLSRYQKELNNKQWYKDYLDYLDARSFTNSGNSGYSFQSFENSGVSEYKRMKVNYDLYNNIVNIKDLAYVTSPYGSDVGELPANMTNRDICSSKIKVLLGMEMKRPFPWKVIAVNKEATTRREKKEFELHKDYVKAEILKPIRAEIERKTKQQTLGRELTPEEQQQIDQQIEQELQARTPEEVRKYMERDHQDPAEVQASQLMDYLLQKEDVRYKFNKGFKHLCLSAKEIYYVGIINGEPIVYEVNPLYFDYDKSPDQEFIEDGQWAVNEFRLSPADVVAWFGDELTDKEIDEIYNYNSYNRELADNDFNFNSNKEDYGWTIRVIHGTWKALRKLGFLKYKNPNNPEGEPLEKIVDESYKLNEELGDISITWRQVPEVYEGYKIGNIAYAGMKPIEGQFSDLDKVFEAKLPYVGAVMDSTNSLPTSPMDRIKTYQYYYNIIMYRIELLMASDKGKILMMNIGAIPESLGIDAEKWLYFLESTKVGWFDPNQEGNRGDSQAGSMAKEIDMSLATDIQKYINLAEYIDRRAGTSIGVPPEAEGQIGPNQAVTNTKQTLTQSSHVLEPIFDLHNHVKRNVLQRMIDVAKVAYSEYPKRKLSYILDDLSKHMLTLDTELLDSSTYGIFVSNSSKAFEVQQLITQLAHAALQNQQADLSDVIKVARAESTQEAEENLIIAEERKREENRRARMEELEKQQEIQKEKIQADKESREFDRETKLLEIEKKGNFDIQKQAMLSMGFNEDKDVDKDGKLDILEVAEQGVDANIKQRKQDLDEKKFQHQKKMDEKKLKLEKQKKKD